FFQITLGNSGHSFKAEGIPAAAGKTGSVKCTIDQTGLIVSAPIQEADAVRKQMFDNIDARALGLLGDLFLQMPSKAEEIAHALESQQTLPNTFSRLDSDGDGQVTFTEILNYKGTGAGFLSDFLGGLATEMQLGAGGENVSTLPGVTLDMLRSPSGED